jgi:molybdopterin-guanine dinucleotide biosynthesis protein A
MTLSAVLLAGGESRRMGADKAQIIFEGEPLWQRQIRLLHQLKPREVFISGREEPAWRPREIESVLDETPSRGPMSGISAALSRTQSSHLLVLAVDMPSLLEKDLHRLVSFIEPGRGVVPVIDRRAEPLAAIYAKDSLVEFDAALSSDDTSLQSLVKRLAERAKVKLVELSRTEAERYQSLNTPKDLPDMPDLLGQVGPHDSWDV